MRRNHEVAMTRQAHSQALQALRKLALRYPETEEAIACKGTALECSAFKARKKTFLFLSHAELKLKLQQSLPEAEELAEKAPERYKAGSGGWVTVMFRDATPPLDLLERWLDESYRLVAPKQLVAALPQRDPPSAASTRGVNKNAQKRRRHG
jgi:hypothetical protein